MRLILTKVIFENEREFHQQDWLPWKTHDDDNGELFPSIAVNKALRERGGAACVPDKGLSCVAWHHDPLYHATKEDGSPLVVHRTEYRIGGVVGIQA